MRGKSLAGFFILCLVVVAVSSCGREKPIDVARIMAEPKAYVGGV